MKIGALVLVILLALLLAWWFLFAGRTATFSGVLRDPAGKPIPGASVTVGGNTTTTDDAGRFTIKGKPVDGRWVVDIRQPGFAPVSKVFYEGSTGLTVTAVKTTKQTFSAGANIVLKDVRADCVGSEATGPNWSAHPEARFAQVFDGGGNRVIGAVPAAAQKLIGFLSVKPPCSSGFQVSIPANSLVTSAGQPATGSVDVEVSTVDLYSADGMPGDYTVTGKEKGGSPAYMESLGAGTITVRSGADTLQLRQGANAEILIPVDRGQIDAGATVPPTIPLLQYDAKSGGWQSIGSAALDATKQNYVATVAHFSEFNADIMKTNPACVRFDASGITGDFDLVVTGPTSNGGYKQVTKHVQPNNSQANPNLHALYNVPANDWVALRVITSGVPVGTWVVATGAPWGNGGAPSYDYAACGGATFMLNETVTNNFTFDGATHLFGPLPKHISYLVKTNAGVEDVYPVGGTNCNNPCSYLFSMFDTGANLVKLDSVLTPFMGLGFAPAASWDVDVRLTGLGALAAGTANPGSPSALPGTAGGGAQTRSGELRIAPRNDMTQITEQHADATTGAPLTGFIQVNYMLVGSPVTNRVVVRIDYTNRVTRGPWTFLGTANAFTVTGPDLQFIKAGDPIPPQELTLFVERFGSAAANANGTTDQRPFLQNVTLAKGTARVFDDQTTSSPVRFFYDSATTFTVISQALATTLGATPAAPNAAAGCSSTNTANFVRLDSITIVGMNNANQLGTYVINNAEVCVDVGATVIRTQYPDPANPAAGRDVDAIIGASLFDQAKILWNGPRLTLGIIR